MERKERCAYAVLKVRDDICIEARCNGYSDACFHYISLEHLKQFNKLFGEGNGKINLDDIVIERER